MVTALQRAWACGTTQGVCTRYRPTAVPLNELLLWHCRLKAINTEDGRARFGVWMYKVFLGRTSRKLAGVLS